MVNAFELHPRMICWKLAILDKFKMEVILYRVDTHIWWLRNEKNYDLLLNCTLSKALQSTKNIFWKALKTFKLNASLRASKRLKNGKMKWSLRVELNKLRSCRFTFKHFFKHHPLFYGIFECSLTQEDFGNLIEIAFTELFVRKLLVIVKTISSANSFLLFESIVCR